ncbi:MAG: CPBP family intramembrane glutamic endopeptidase [Candidatus Acidiferrales bacterium]
MILFHAVNFTAIPWDFTVILLALATLIPWRGVVRIGRLMRRPDLSSTDRLSLYGSTIAGQWLIAGIVSWRAFARGMSPQELGLTIFEPWKSAWIAAVVTLLLAATQFAAMRMAVSIPAEQRGSLFRITEKIMPRTSVDAVVYAALAATAGLSEEFLYRGFVFAVFLRMLAHTAAPAIYAAVISSAWFGAAHLYQGRRGLITTFVVGLIFVAMRVYSGNLLPPIIAHVAIDLTVGLCVPRLLRKA